MSTQAKTRLVKYGCALGVSVLFSVLYLYLAEVVGFSSLPLSEKYRILCDTFTVPGLLLVMGGLMMFVSSQGGLDGVSYVLKNGLRLLIPFGGNKKMEHYDDYVRRRKARRSKGFGFLFVVGFADLAIAAVFLMLYLTVC